MISVAQSVSNFSNIPKSMLNLNDTQSYDGIKNDISQEVVNFSTEIDNMNIVHKRIKSLAEDTSLVALNASIGADRASASGKDLTWTPMKQAFCRITQK